MKPALDLSLYLVLDPDLCDGGQGMVDTALAAVAGGVTIVQLRAPRWKKRQWVAVAMALKAALDPHHIPLIINDHIDVALLVDAAGVHVGQQDIAPGMARQLIGPHKILGLSISNAEQMAAAPLGVVDYIGVGPVFATGTKLDASPVIGLEEFTSLMQAKSLPAVAIGGIGLGHVAALLSAGADGVAVVSAICGQNNPQQAAQALRLEGAIGCNYPAGAGRMVFGGDVDD
ncbi:thiamine phosphate synthase [Iodobacter ciconiae]|uniref:Thiamine-phosphate synthase n=1 Tax=Iodobacter ciconiae TaxID=2496266 RepID=A0A3S8ZS78_9NEIS|nr:thiamine phosphate synthase [Iodobacter ciconiae]AZN36336.1 thiamine phosphate synthase [Iodobacter ciconiae]